MTIAIPRSPGELTRDWLTEALSTGTWLGPVRVGAAEVESIGRGTGLLCQLARVTLAYEPGGPAGPRTLVAKLAAADDDIRGMVGLFRFYEREVRFYEELASSLSIGVPRCYWSAYDQDGGDFVLLLEDLGALRAADQLAPGSGHDARLVADLLVELHARWWNDGSLDALPWLPPVDSEINKLGLGLYAQAWPSFLERLGDRLPREALEVGARLGSRSVALLDELAQSPRTLCHGDVRLDNIFFGPGDDSPPILLDWQIAGRGVGTYDLAYFMSQSLDPDVRCASERDLLARYHAGLVTAGIRGYDFEQCLLDYRRSVLFGFVYPVIGGGLGDMANDRGVALARVMAERSAAAILDWNAAELLPA
jgi:hypothetical protein